MTDSSFNYDHYHERAVNVKRTQTILPSIDVNFEPGNVLATYLQQMIDWQRLGHASLVTQITLAIGGSFFLQLVLTLTGLDSIA